MSQSTKADVSKQRIDEFTLQVLVPCIKILYEVKDDATEDYSTVKMDEVSQFIFDAIDKYGPEIIANASNINSIFKQMDGSYLNLDSYTYGLLIGCIFASELNVKLMTQSLKEFTNKKETDNA